MQAFSGVMTFRTEIQKLLFMTEIMGQLSDGYWESIRPQDHWRVWCNCEIKVGEKVGRNFYAQKDNYNLNAKGLLDCVGDRMINYVKMFKAFPNIDIGILQSAAYHPIEELEKRRHEHDYWQKMYERITSVLTTEQVQAALVADSYSMKELQADLKDMKAQMKLRSDS